MGGTFGKALAFRWSHSGSISGDVLVRGCSLHLFYVLKKIVKKVKMKITRTFSPMFN